MHARSPKHSGDVIKPVQELIPTRWSLIGRLKDLADDKSWQEFVEIYWRLIYNVARKKLTHCEAEDAVVGTFSSISRHIDGGSFKPDPTRGSFKNYLLQVTRWRICDEIRKRPPYPNGSEEASTSSQEDNRLLFEPFVDHSENPFAALWDAEWEQALTNAALASVRQQVSGRQLQIFCLLVIHEMPLSVVCATLKINAPQAYLAKHRVGRLFRKALKELTVKYQ